MDISIGCTGWGYKDWEGLFYPKTIKQKDWLKHYSSIFDITEVNTTFYQIIPKSLAYKWEHDTPPNFRFSLKFPKSVTHEKKLDYKKSKETLSEFFRNIEPLQKKIQVLLIQLPPSLKFQDIKEKLEELTNHLPNFCRYAIEGRNQSWFSEESLKFLRDKKYCLVWNEIPMIENPAPITTDFIYTRIIGDRNLLPPFDHKLRDKSDVLKKWSKKILQVDRKDLKFAWILLNNHLEGFAPSSASSFGVLLGKKKLGFRDKDQKTIIHYT